jgi:two-component system sensor histidine kinase PilS (NtrC family)
MARRQALSVQSRDTFWRSLQTLNATRVVIAMVLLLYLSFDSRGVRASQHLYAETCIAYLVAALAFGVLTIYWRRRFLEQRGSQIALAIGVISVWYVSVCGFRSVLAML